MKKKEISSQCINLDLNVNITLINRMIDLFIFICTYG